MEMDKLSILPILLGTVVTGFWTVNSLDSLAVWTVMLMQEMILQKTDEYWTMAFLASPICIETA